MILEVGLNTDYKLHLDSIPKVFYITVNLHAEPSSLYNPFLLKVQKVLDAVTPEKKVKLLKRRILWYDSDLMEQWKIVRNHERCWMRYEDNSHWHTYKCERNWYNNMQTYKRKNKIMKEILDCGKDTKNYINSWTI